MLLGTAYLQDHANFLRAAEPAHFARHCRREEFMKLSLDDRLILVEIAERGENTVAGLAHLLDLTEPQVRRRLGVLMRAGFVGADGEHYIALPPAAMTSPAARKALAA
jgi:winged helix-turn-helix DNA-binding protein